MTDANSGQSYNLYRWPSADPTLIPSLVYSGDPGTSLAGGSRWGDTMDVRGSGTSTEILIDANVGTLAAVFNPTDETLSAFVPTAFGQTYGSGSIGRSLQFGGDNTFWQKREGSRLQLSEYDLAAQNSVALTNYSGFPASLGPVDLDLAHKILAGINFSGSTNTPDRLDLYDISDFNHPLLIAGYNFPTKELLNGNFIGQVLFAGNKVYALDGNNGIVAFTVVLPAAPQLSITRTGSDVVLSWSSSAAGFVLQRNAGLVPADWMDVSTTPTIVNGQNTVSENASNGKTFYRLRRP